MNIRKITLNDALAISEIYNYYIENSVITFETIPVSEMEMQKRISEIINSGFAFYVGEIDGKVIGYYYTNKWNGRSAYSFTCEVTIYLDKNHTGTGFGSIFYKHLLNNIDRKNFHILIAGICIPNESSVRLHEKFGFKQVSCMKEIGWKFNKWRDVGHWYLVLDN